MDNPVQSETAEARRCRTGRPRPRAEGELRPTDVVGAFFICGVLFLLAAAAVGIAQSIDPWSHGRWLALHLAFVGGASQLVLGASQFFVGAFLATDPPPRRLVRLQLATWNAGTILLAVGVPERSDALIWTATGLLAASLIGWGAAVLAMRRRSLRNAPWATRWYVSSTAFLGLGVVAGALLANAVAWIHGDLLSAHMSLNLAGWLGGAIVGTLHTFYPSLTQTELRFPRLQGIAFAAWTGGVAALAVGYAWAIDGLAIAGWLALCLGSLALLANVAASLRSAPQPLSLAARIVGAAQFFLPLGVLVATGAAIDAGPLQALAGSTRAVVGTLLVCGWIGLTVLGSLLHLLAVVIRVRDFSQQMPSPNPRFDRFVAALATAGIAVLALSQQLDLEPWRGAAAAALIVAYAILASRVAVLAARIAIRARPSI